LASTRLGGSAVGRRIIGPGDAKSPTASCSSSKQLVGVVVASCRVKKALKKSESGLLCFETTLSEPEGLGTGEVGGSLVVACSPLPMGGALALE